MTDIGVSITDLTFMFADGQPGSLGAYRGAPLVVYFYPKDDTPGCTNEAKGFSDLMPEFEALGTKVLGVSKDTASSHLKFIKKYDLKVALVADQDGTMCEGFGVWVEKSMYGKTYMGIERATFLIDREGVVVQVWRKVKVAGHAQSVLEAAKQAAT